MALVLLVMVLGVAGRLIGIKPKPAGAKPGSALGQKTPQVLWTAKIMARAGLAPGEQTAGADRGWLLGGFSQGKRLSARDS